MIPPPAPIRLGPPDAERYVRLRLRMLLDSPWAFGASPEDSETVRPAFCARMFGDEDHATFAIEESGAGGEAELVATASISRARPIKHAHRAAIWAVFVEPVHRGQGLGRTVLAATIDQARAWPGVDWIDLGVSGHSPDARRLYEDLGFVAWGIEPDATEVDGHRYDEVHLTMRL